jgi:hypothetical protein
VLRSVFPDAQCICLHRHALDQVRSSLDVEGAVHVQAVVARYQGDVVAALVDRWCSVTEKLLAFEHVQGEAAIRVTYERFVEAPEEELHRVMRFLDLAPANGLLAAAFRERHDSGPADIKIRGAKAVERDRVGKGRDIDLSRVPNDLRDRLGRLLAVVGYRS